MVALTRPQRHDEGLGLTEVLIAIVLFGLLAVAAIPALIMGVKIAGQTPSIATAAGVATTQIEVARAHTANCAEFLAFLDAPISAAYEDARGGTYTVTQTSSAEVICDDAAPVAHQILEYTVNVVGDSLDNPQAANVTTKIAVPPVS